MNIIDHYYRHTPWSKRKKTTEIILHCSATKRTKPNGKNYTVDDIDSWHRQRKFNGIGYNYVISIDGAIHRGRDEEAVGAHCSGHNSIAIGICYIGGIDENGKCVDTRTDAQKKSMVELVKYLQKKYKIDDNHVFGHYQFAKKACPCFKAEDFRKELK